MSDHETKQTMSRLQKELQREREHAKYVETKYEKYKVKPIFQFKMFTMMQAICRLKEDHLSEGKNRVGPVIDHLVPD